jgi:hypothetical protein
MDLDEEPVNNVDKTAENMDVDEPPTHIVNDLKLKLLSAVEDSRPGTPVEGSFTYTPTSSQTPQSINPCVRLLAKAVLQVLLVLLLKLLTFFFELILSVYFTHVKSSQLVNKMCSHCLFRVVDKSGTSCYHLVTRLTRPTDW